MVDKKMAHSDLPDQLAARYVDVVYAAALRQTNNNPQASADITQAVFLIAVQKAKTNRLPEEARMLGWLLKVTNYAVRESRRAESRRAYHEQRAAEAKPETVEDVVDAREITAALDGALLKLGSIDREVLVRRYLQGDAIANVAAVMGMTENTAGRRIARSLEKLRKIFARRGVVAPVGGVVAAMMTESLQAAPVEVMTTVASPSGAGVAAVGIAKGATAMMKMAAMKSAGVAVAITVMLLLVGCVITNTLEQRQNTAAPAYPALAANRDDWQSVFKNTYALQPGQYLKFVPPDRIPPERNRYFAEVEHDNTPAPFFSGWRWDGQKIKRWWISIAPPEGESLAQILRFSVNLDPLHTSLVNIPHINLDGDWIVREGAPTKAILSDLHTILLEQFQIDLDMAESKVIADTIVVTGDFILRPLPDNDSRTLQIYSNVLDHPKTGDRVEGGGAADPNEFWTTIGLKFGIPIVDEAKCEPTKIRYLLSESVRDADKDATKRQQILDNLSKQTGLSFIQEKRALTIWKFTPATASTAPTSTPTYESE